ncbi:zinc-binding alcohol dehydrogenase family protein [Myxosarcina sp. GI1]|uniref:quinone oxidoreductase family protein n=1 Tax=Myxosarcina sp. GI1 TaxID=1541065 RepID=UPI00055FE985|nr:zinc-binding alcohol dehydrogenase family protein [Myxosarcina sp. GI1]
MLSVRINHFGSPSELQLEELPKPSVSRNEVLVKIHAAGINPGDVKNVAGTMLHTSLPRTPGRDFAGIMVEGSDSLLGKEVWGTGGDIGFIRDGTHAEYILLPQTAVCAKPSNLSMEHAGSIGVTYVTAWLCLNAVQLKADETVLVVGATGGVGSAAIQIAKWQGARVLGTVRRESDRHLARQSNPDVILNLDGELDKIVLVATNGEGVNVVVDTVGGAMVEPCLKSLSHRGRLVEISAPAKERRISFDAIDFYHRESRLIGVDSRSLDSSACAQILTTITPGFETDALHPIGELHSYPLQSVATAYEQVLNRRMSGRVLLTPQFG